MCLGHIENVHVAFWMEKIDSNRIRPFELSFLGSILYSRIMSMCNQLLQRFSVHSFQTLCLCCGQYEDMHVLFWQR